MNGHPNLTGSRCQCPACGEYFASVTVFDRHRVGDFASGEQPSSRRCLTVAEMMAQEWPKNGKGFWLRPVSRAVYSDLGGPPSPPPATRAKAEPAWA
jgi:hypothetical protein